MKKKGTKHNKYTGTARYNNITVLKLDNYQHLLISEIAEKYNTSKSAVIRLALNQFIKEYNESI